MAWTYTQAFDGLTTADLNGQDSWSGATQFDVSTTSPEAGTKCVVATGDGTERSISRADTYLSDGDTGAFEVSMRSADNAGGGSNQRWIFKVVGVGQIHFNNVEGKIQCRYGEGGSTFLDLVTGFTADQWYTFVFDINNSAKTFRVNVDGGSFSSSLAFETGALTDVASLVMEMGSSLSGQVGLDSIAPFTVPASGPANLKSYNTNLKANIKSINTNLIANVKSLNTNV